MSPSNPCARVLLVDDHPALLRQVARLLAGEFEVVGVLPDGRDLPQTVAARHPDLVVLDIALPGRSGIELARDLGQTPGGAGIVFLTVHEDPDYAREAFAAGALGYVVKSRLALDLIAALRAALAHRRFISPSAELGELAQESIFGNRPTL